jgi:methylthioribose-1-phosphate isomerase
VIKPLFWKNQRLFIVDQTRLPGEYRLIEIRDHLEMAEAIRTLAIRGAPALGIAAAFGLVIGLKPFKNSSKQIFLGELQKIADMLQNTRPTAVNLAWALERMRQVAQNLTAETADSIWQALLKEALRIHREDIAMCRKIARHGQILLPDEANVITHCNAGGLATGGLGTVLGILITAHQGGKQIHVYVDETRPLLQGARLTCWELNREGVPFTLISDNMAAYLMANRKIAAVITGADRIAANGDAANKIGTCSLAILANYHNIPFYIAAPSSTIDPSINSGSQIRIEERSGSELREISGIRIVPENYPAISPAFDVTPHPLITAIITETGIKYPPFQFRQ